MVAAYAAVHINCKHTGRWRQLLLTSHHFSDSNLYVYLNEVTFGLHIDVPVYLDIIEECLKVEVISQNLRSRETVRTQQL